MFSDSKRSLNKLVIRGFIFLPINWGSFDVPGRRHVVYGVFQAVVSMLLLMGLEIPLSKEKQRN